MNLVFEPIDELDARRRISQLREQIELVTSAYQSAKEEHRVQDVTSLLRQRTELVQRLFQTQRELLRSWAEATAHLQDIGATF